MSQDTIKRQQRLLEDLNLKSYESGFDKHHKTEATMKKPRDLDMIISKAISLLCRKVVDLLEICEKHDLQPDEQKTFTHTSHSEWSFALLDNYM